MLVIEQVFDFQLVDFQRVDVSLRVRVVLGVQGMSSRRKTLRFLRFPM